MTEQGDPLVLRRKHGKGEVYLVAAHHLQEISGLHRPNGLLEVAKFLIGHVLAPYQKLRVRGPHLNYLVNETSDGLAVMLLNNSPDEWLGWVTFPGLRAATATEHYAEERLHCHLEGCDLSVRLRIPGNSLRLLSVRRGRA